MPDQLTEWLQNAADWSEIGESDSLAWLRRRPVLFVGLGKAGEKILGHLANYLSGRVGANWRQQVQHIQLLHIGISDAEDAIGGVQHALGFPSLTLPLNNDRTRRMTWHEGITGWCDRSRLSRLGRCKGRLAVFADLGEGKAQSLLWRTLISSVGELSDLSVYIISDAFSDDSSGMIADIAHLLKVSRPNQVSRMFVCLVMQNAQWSDDLPSSKRNERVFAVLRELQRLRRKSKIDWIYAPNLGQKELAASTTEAICDQVFLFDGIGEHHRLKDYPPEAALFPYTAGCLTALLSEKISQKFYEIWINQVSETVRNSNVSMEQVAGSMGCYTVRLPIEELSNVIQGRLVHQYLFQLETGVLGWEDLNVQGKPQQRGALVPLDIKAGEIQSFLQDNRLTLDGARNLNHQGILRVLLPFLTRKVNREHCSMRWILQFCVALTKDIPTWKPEVDKVEQTVQEWIAVAYAGDESRATQQPAWSTMLKPSAPVVSVQMDLHPGLLYKAWDLSWAKARKTFELAQNSNAVRVLWSLDREYELYSMLPTGLWNKVGERTFWGFEERGNSIQLFLWILPDALAVMDPNQPHQTIRDTWIARPIPYAYTPRDITSINQHLFHIARRLVDLSAREIFPEIIGKEKDIAVDLVQKGSIMCSRGEPPEKWPIAVEPYWFYAAPDNLRAVKQELLTTKAISAESHNFITVATDDQTECRLLTLNYILPLQSMDTYVGARQAYHPQPDLHVWQAERSAALWEDKARQKLENLTSQALAFSPALIEILARDSEGVALFTLAFLYQLLTLNMDTLKISCPVEFCEDFHNLPVIEAIQVFSSSLIRVPGLATKINDWIALKRPAEYMDRINFLDGRKRQLIEPLVSENQSAAHDLALLLGAAIINEERWQG